jgi:hypothetical protein
MINIYGDAIGDKWDNLLDRMRTTGVFLFADFKLQYYNWPLVSVALRALIMAISTIAGRVVPAFLFAMLVVYELHCGREDVDAQPPRGAQCAGAEELGELMAQRTSSRSCVLSCSPALKFKGW